MTTKQELEDAVKSAKSALTDANKALEEFSSLAENNVFETLEKALSTVEEALGGQAFEDCEGAGNCGAESYSQKFMVDGVRYVGTLSCAYNRHDKTYYYVEESEFSHCVDTSETTTV